jgi:signal transduction histidine kinase
MKVRFSLLLRIYLATAVALTALFAATVWFVQHQAGEALRAGVSQEVAANLRSVDALWRSHAATFSTASAILASMSDVRAAFGTRDAATIRDTAGELWSRVAQGHDSQQDAAFVVADPHGTILASLGKESPPALRIGGQLPPDLLDASRRRFPSQLSTFAAWDGDVWQVILTPVYVSGGKVDALLNVLLAAHPIRRHTLVDLKGGASSDFLLRTGGRTTITTLASDEAANVIAHPNDYETLKNELQDASGKPLGELWAVRSLAGIQSRISDLRRTILLYWLAAMAAGLALSYFLARRIVEPLRVLNAAAQQVSDENYSVRVPEDSGDELGVLARTFNRMSASIESAREERVRREQITAVGRLAASVAHDLRNPLAAIVGGTEMLAEFELPPSETKKTVLHMHHAAKRMQSLLSELSQVARTKAGQQTLCNLDELVNAAVESQEGKAAEQEVAIKVNVAPDLAVKCEKSRVERVFVNLIANALEVMPQGGEISIDGAYNNASVFVDVRDTGPGVPAEIRNRMFQPFVTAGKKNGLGLGLALARQTIIDHQGDLELIPSERGAHFRLTMPLAS